MSRFDDTPADRDMIRKQMVRFRCDRERICYSSAGFKSFDNDGPNGEKYSCWCIGTKEGGGNIPCDQGKNVGKLWEPTAA